jgi:hypothetical protein
MVAAALVHFRSHERKLLGSYGLQRTWLIRNRAAIEKDYYYGSRQPGQAEEPETSAANQI